MGKRLDNYLSKNVFQRFKRFEKLPFKNAFLKGQNGNFNGNLNGNQMGTFNGN